MTQEKDVRRFLYTCATWTLVTGQRCRLLPIALHSKPYRFAARQRLCDRTRTVSGPCKAWALRASCITKWPDSLQLQRDSSLQVRSGRAGGGRFKAVNNYSLENCPWPLASLSLSCSLFLSFSLSLFLSFSFSFSFSFCFSVSFSLFLSLSLYLSSLSLSKAPNERFKTLLPPRPESAFSLCLPKPCCSLGWSTRPETARVSSAKARLFSSSASAVQQSARARGPTRHAPTRTRGPKRHVRHQAQKLGEVKASFTLATLVNGVIAMASS